MWSRTSSSNDEVKPIKARVRVRKHAVNFWLFLKLWGRAPYFLIKTRLSILKDVLNIRSEQRCNSGCQTLCIFRLSLESILLSFRWVSDLKLQHVNFNRDHLVVVIIMVTTPNRKTIICCRYIVHTYWNGFLIGMMWMRGTMYCGIDWVHLSASNLLVEEYQDIYLTFKFNCLDIIFLSLRWALFFETCFMCQIISQGSERWWLGANKESTDRYMSSPWSARQLGSSMDAYSMTSSVSLTWILPLQSLCHLKFLDDGIIKRFSPPKIIISEHSYLY